MKNSTLILSGLMFVLLTSCGKVKDYSLSQDTTPLPMGKVLFSEDGHCFFNEMTITDSYVVFTDIQSDTIIKAYHKNNFKTQPLVLVKRSGSMSTLTPKLIYKVSKKNDNDTFSAIDEYLFEKTFTLHSPDFDVKTTQLKRNIIPAFNFYKAGNELYASPLMRSYSSPFYYYNPKDNYFWVDPSDKILAALPQNDDAYACTLCVNEKVATAVAAYRYTNFLTFYNLKGDAMVTVSIGDKTIAPVITHDEVDVLQSEKCFTAIAGSPQYVYCVYNGSNDFNTLSKIFVFKWNGKHVATWQVDRNCRTIAVDKNDKYLIAISSRSDGGQDILKYDLTK